MLRFWRSDIVMRVGFGRIAVKCHERYSEEASGKKPRVIPEGEVMD